MSKTMTADEISAAEREMFPDADPERPYFPDAEVELTGGPDHAVLIFMKVRRALERAGAGLGEVALFMSIVTSGDYNNVIATCMRWAEVS
jgi:hypothetical protein